MSVDKLNEKPATLETTLQVIIDQAETLRLLIRREKKTISDELER